MTMRPGRGAIGILVKIASTWEGSSAAEVLEKDGIHCNLTLLFGLHQADCGADAGATAGFSTFDGALFLDWSRRYRQGFSRGPTIQACNRDQGYTLLQEIRLQDAGYGACFRNIGGDHGNAGSRFCFTFHPATAGPSWKATQGRLPPSSDPQAAQ